MHSNNNHNKWSAGQLSTIIDSIRDSNNGKCSVRMVAERIGRGEWETWQLLHDSGCHTRLYEESLEYLAEEIEKEAGKLTLRQLYSKYGQSWKHKSSFCCFLWRNNLQWKKGVNVSIELVNDFENRGYNYSELSLAEIAEMYSLSYQTVFAVAKRYKIPHAVAPRGPVPKVKA